MDQPLDVDRHITELWDDLPNHAGTARAELLMELAEHLLNTERYSEALPALEIAEEAFVETHHDRLAGRAAHNRGVVLGHLHRHEERLAAERSAIDHYGRADRRDLAGCSRMALGFHLRNDGQLKRAVPIFKAAVADFEASRQLMHLGNALMALLEAEIDLGRFPAALRLLRPTSKVLATTAPIPVVASYHELAATVFEHRSGPGRAIRELRSARAVWDAFDEVDAVARCEIRMATLSIETEGPKAAVTALQSLRPERRDAGDVAGVAACDRGLGMAALERNRPNQALRRLEDAAAVFNAAGLLADAAECDALAAEALRRLGRADEAQRQLRRVLPTLVSLHRPIAEADARLSLARLHLDAGEPVAAHRQAKKAESIGRRGIVNTLLDGSRAVLAEAARRSAGEPATA